ncbi:uncharacterized protein LOC126374096 [Pectinophora gossypiella]|uniref:Uncharacterized protein n=1 Tax=Pectinophora gossypiella TaxID=13191 RepID=A0A1E1W402_PECGO|nr:uncharacterized protein LOC126374096 [Pectinophora gossypiella]
MARSVALSFAFLLAVFEIGSCTRCYQCNSQSDRDCLDPFVTSGRFLVDCNTQDSVSYNRLYLRDVLPSQLVDGVAGAPRYCAKLVLQTGTTIRTCLDANPLEPSQTCRALERIDNYANAGSRQAVKHCSVCTTDICNGSGAIAASYPLAILAAVASYLYCKQ